MSPSSAGKIKMPKLDVEARAFFESVVPEHPDVQVRPMFGQVSAFVNGNMFMGVFGTDVFVRLPEEDGAALLKAGGHAFEPMKGRPMRGYVILPDAWQRRRGKVKEWAARSLDWAEELPPKASRPKSTNKAASKKSPAKAKPGTPKKKSSTAKRSRA
jgi:TfoX/Sxy family transcriptional regulator of competence genes